MEDFELVTFFEVLMYFVFTALIAVIICVVIPSFV